MYWNGMKWWHQSLASPRGNATLRATAAKFCDVCEHSLPPPCSGDGTKQPGACKVSRHPPLVLILHDLMAKVCGDDHLLNLALLDVNVIQELVDECKRGGFCNQQLRFTRVLRQDFVSKILDERC